MKIASIICTSVTHAYSVHRIIIQLIIRHLLITEQSPNRRDVGPTVYMFREPKARPHTYCLQKMITILRILLL